MRPDLVTSSAAPTVLREDCIYRIRKPEPTHAYVEARGKLRGAILR